MSVPRIDCREFFLGGPCQSGNSDRGFSYALMEKRREAVCLVYAL